MMRISKVDSDFKQIVEEGRIKSVGGQFNLKTRIESGGIDLPPTEDVWQLKGPITPSKNQTVWKFIKEYGIRKVDLTKEPLIPFNYYASPSIETTLLQNEYSMTSAPSTIGRNNFGVRGVFDYMNFFDSNNHSKTSRLWIEMNPKSFFMNITTENSLLHLKIFDKNKISKTNIEDLPIFKDENGEVLENDVLRDLAAVELYCPENALVAYKAKKGVKDEVSLIKNSNEYKRFFEPIYTHDKPEITLEADNFYIMAGKNIIIVPIKYSAQMVKYAEHLPPIESHQAAFFNAGHNGAPVMEIVPITNVAVQHAMAVCFMEYFKNTRIPDKPYKGAYQNKIGPVLAKNFKMD